MAKSQLPQPAVVVLDPDRPLANAVARRLRSDLPGVKVIAFRDRSAAWQALKAQRKLELHVVITDTIGVLPRARCFVRWVARSYPRCKIVLFAGEASSEDVVSLQNDQRLIDRYVKKDYGIDKLAEVARDYSALYQQDPILDSLRRYLGQCRYPQASFMQMGSKKYSLVDIYWEIVRKSDVGILMEDVWRSLLIKAALVEERTGVEK